MSLLFTSQCQLTDPLPSFLDGRSFVASFVCFDYGGLELDFEEN